ncbi:MAG: RNA pseudouridine synthase, partial [Mesorhizobium sp.]
MLRQDELPGDELDGKVELEAGADAAGKRLDQWLTAQLGPEISRSRVQALIKQGAVTIAGKPVE